MVRGPPADKRKRTAPDDKTDDNPPKRARYNLRARAEALSMDTEDSIPETSQETESEYVEASQESAPPKAAAARKPAAGVPLALTRAEKAYYNALAPAQRAEMLMSMKSVSALINNEGDVPLKFRVLQLPVSDHMKSLVLKKMDALNESCGDSSGMYKVKTWVDGFLKIPFGKSVPLPVQMSDGVEKCTDFLVKARADMNKHIYGMNDAKIQIMQIMSQWVANPGSAGNVIALHGPAGVGKTSFAKNAIADVLRRPFAFFALGGASDIANFTGHAYTYEGSSWGRITDALMQTGTMNPVVYFDELDKISTTPQGDEIISMLIHLTDRSQNSEFHDRYFAGVDFDMSQCLFVFSFNDIEKVHPILRDRMTIIECGGYGEKDKREILKNYVWPQVLTRLNFSSDQVAFEEDAVKHLIEQYSGSESGVRNLIRAVETMMTRVNMLRLAQHESMKDYPFYLDVKFPMSITKKVIDTLMKDAQKIKQDEAWRSMFT
jgi:ATP-dependent Lon protease